MANNTYILVLAGAFLSTFLLSFDKRVQFFRKWRFLLPAITSVAIPFLIWDILFTKHGVWGFNPAYIKGIYIFYLPLEEVLFFFVIPYCSVFLYEVFQYYFPRLLKYSFQAKMFVFVFMWILIGIAIIFHSNVYTLTTSLFAACTAFLLFRFLPERIIPFHVSFIVLLLPFSIVNGILTGSGIQQEVVWYNETAIIGLHLFTIPLEDIIYAYALFGLNILVYSFLKKEV